jgi:two-component system chemotaxis response regulator CheB
VPYDRPVVVIGCSYGCVEALVSLVQTFDREWPAAIFITMHVGAFSILPEVLQPRCALPVHHAKHQERIESGRVYIAPPEYHLCIERDMMRLNRGPRENWCRPAVDPMFRSAAQAHRHAVIAVLMTGLLNDGSLGLYEVQRLGGRTIVQNPEDAAAPGMPQSALSILKPDYVMPLAKIGDAIASCLQLMSPGRATA